MLSGKRRPASPIVLLSASTFEANLTIMLVQALRDISVRAVSGKGQLPMAKKVKRLPAIPQNATEHFCQEIELLLGKIPKKWWNEDIRGVLYEFVPWHNRSSIGLQTAEDDPREIGEWKYYDSPAWSDGALLAEEYEAYDQAIENGSGSLVFHFLLLAAAEALLSTEFTRFINPRLPAAVRNLRFWTATDKDRGLNNTFLLQVYHPDQLFKFNYCEYVCARRLELGISAAPPT